MIETASSPMSIAQAEYAIDLGVFFALGQMDAAGEDITTENLKNKLLQLLSREEGLHAALTVKACYDAAHAQMETIAKAQKLRGGTDC